MKYTPSSGKVRIGVDVKLVLRFWNLSSHSSDLWNLILDRVNVGKGDSIFEKLSIYLSVIPYKSHKTLKLNDKTRPG